jgi:hypothetical protein
MCSHCEYRPRREGSLDVDVEAGDLAASPAFLNEKDSAVRVGGAHILSLTSVYGNRYPTASASSGVATGSEKRWL